MAKSYKVTPHARERSTARDIPLGIAELIMEYGQSRDAGEGARKYTLTKGSMRDLRRHIGREFTKALAPYRNRHAYVVAAGGRIVTVAFASRPLFD